MSRGQFIYDLLERSAKTFVQGYLAVWLVIYNANFDLAFEADSLYAGLAAGAVSLLTSFAGKIGGNTDSAAWLPADKDPSPR